ncbi:MAG: YhjD/YihY/BrkB family envelope integrity protein [Actinomycetota bacterium]
MAEPDEPQPAKPSRTEALRERSDALRERVDQTRDRATGWVEERRVERSKMGAAVNVLIDAWNRDTSAAGGLLAGGLAFRLFLWLLPAALVAVSVLGVATGYSSESASEVARDSGLSAVVAATVAQGVQASQTGGLWVALFGTAFLLWASAGAARGLRVASSLLWQARPRAWNSTRAALAFLGLAIVSISVQTLVGHLWAGGILTTLLARLLTTVVLIAIVCWAFFLLPHDPRAPWWWQGPGAVLVGVGVQLLALATTVYFADKLDRVDDLYGSLGVATVILGWLFLIARLAIWGIGLNVAIWERLGPGPSAGADAAGGHDAGGAHAASAPRGGAAGVS